MYRKKKRSLIAEANRHVSFPQACRWADIPFYGDARERGVKVHCPFGFFHVDGGAEPALRVYPDHGWCFAEDKYFSPVSLLASVWDVSWDDAALEALTRVGWKPATYAHLWEQVTAEPEPDREALTQALIAWCARLDASWVTRQYDERIAATLSRCLALLPLVRTEAECREWLNSCKVVMQRILEGGNDAGNAS